METVIYRNREEKIHGILVQLTHTADDRAEAGTNYRGPEGGP